MLLLGMGTALLAGGACHAVPGTPLTAAAAANDVLAIRRLLARGHAADESGDAWTALMWAARHDAVDAMAALLDAGASVDARDRRNGWTALQHAIHTRNIGAARLLLERGADPNAAAHPGARTPLLMASLESDPAVVKLLLSYRADPRVEGENGDTPLTRAVSGGAMADLDRDILGGCHPATVRALLEHDPSLRLPDTPAGRMAVMWARLHSMRASTREIVHAAVDRDASALLTSGNWQRCREVLSLVERIRS